MRKHPNPTKRRILEAYCQRNAPTPELMETEDIGDSKWAAWPRISYRDWCGEYKPSDPMP